MVCFELTVVAVLVDQKQACSASVVSPRTRIEDICACVAVLLFWRTSVFRPSNNLPQHPSIGSTFPPCQTHVHNSLFDATKEDYSCLGKEI